MPYDPVLVIPKNRSLCQAFPIPAGCDAVLDPCGIPARAGECRRAGPHGGRHQRPGGITRFHMGEGGEDFDHREYCPAGKGNPPGWHLFRAEHLR